MLILQSIGVSKSLSPLGAPKVHTCHTHIYGSPPFDFLSSSAIKRSCTIKPLSCCANSDKVDSEPHPESIHRKSKNSPKRKTKAKVRQEIDENSGEVFPFTIPRKPSRGHRSEAVAVEDFIRDSLERTFASIRQQNPDIFNGRENIMKERHHDKIDNNDHDVDDVDVDDNDDDRERKVVIEEDDPDWPLDADVGWGVRASEYFEKHSIRNVVGEDGVEIDWEGEIDNNWVKEINCLEWESFAFHPSPLIVLVFERYKRATDNWKVLKELEKATKVYWSAKDRLPPRTVKIDINIEKDLAYALKVKECPQLLFLRGNKILYREKEIRKADELVHMIAHFYYNAKKPSWIDDAAVCSPY